MEPAAPAPAAASTTRGGRRPRDMALSMVVLLVPVLLLVVFYRFLGNETPPVVDTTEPYGAAQRANAFPVVTPASLPKGWRIANATFRDKTLRIGVTTDDEGAMQVVETADTPDAVLPAELGAEARAGGTVDIGGAAWQRYTDGRNGERALVLATPGRTVVVVGKAKDAELRTLAGALR